MPLLIGVTTHRVEYFGECRAVAHGHIVEEGFFAAYLLDPLQGRWKRLRRRGRSTVDAVVNDDDVIVLLQQHEHSVGTRVACATRHQNRLGHRNCLRWN